MSDDLATLSASIIDLAEVKSNPKANSATQSLEKCPGTWPTRIPCAEAASTSMWFMPVLGVLITFKLGSKSMISLPKTTFDCVKPPVHSSPCTCSRSFSLMLVTGTWSRRMKSSAKCSACSRGIQEPAGVGCVALLKHHTTGSEDIIKRLQIVPTRQDLYPLQDGSEDILN